MLNIDPEIFTYLEQLYKQGKYSDWNEFIELNLGLLIEIFYPNPLNPNQKLPVKTHN